VHELSIDNECLYTAVVAPPAGKTTLLVVEDDPPLRAFYGRVLRHEGFLIEAVEDGMEALARIDIRAPDLIILDLALPRLSGLDVQRELAARPNTRHIPIIIVTGTELEGPLGANVCAVLRKPVDADALVAAVWNYRRGRVAT
jgi:CheY-like chemotaxis protein